MCDRVSKLAEDGERWAVELVWDRLEGKPVQGVEITGEVQITKIICEIVEPQLVSGVVLDNEPIEDKPMITKA